MAQTYNLTSDGSTSALQSKGNLNVAAYGTFGGGTLSIQASYDGGSTWFTLKDANGADGSFTSAGALNVRIGEANLRFTLSGATSPNLNISITDIEFNSKF